MTATGLIYLVAQPSRWAPALLRVRQVLYAIFGGYLRVFYYQLDMPARLSQW